jgi:hypothetical protein
MSVSEPRRHCPIETSSSVDSLRRPDGDHPSSAQLALRRLVNHGPHLSPVIAIREQPGSEARRGRPQSLQGGKGRIS